MAVLADLPQVVSIVALQYLNVVWATPGATDRVDLKRQVPKPQVIVEMPGHGHHLYIQGRILLTQGLHTDLMVLSIPTSLRSLVPECGTHAVYLHRLGPNVQTMLQIGAHNTRREFWAEGQLVPTSISKGVHLLVHHVRAFANALHKDGRLLKDGHIERLVTIQLSNGLDALNNVSPVRLLIRQDVPGTTRCGVQRRPSLAHSCHRCRDPRRIIAQFCSVVHSL
jgi:hypothetical protein